jgi:hypothetical protein
MEVNDSISSWSIEIDPVVSYSLKKGGESVEKLEEAATALATTVSGATVTGVGVPVAVDAASDVSVPPGFIVCRQNDTGAGELGSRVWPGTRVLCAAVEDEAFRAAHLVCACADAADATWVELGAGVGLGTLVASGTTSTESSPQRVVATDRPSLLPLLRTNQRVNAAAAPTATALPLDWYRPDDTTAFLAAHPHTSLVFGADLSYDLDHLDALVSTIVGLLAGSRCADPRCLVVYGTERFVMHEFFRRASVAGLSATPIDPTTVAAWQSDDATNGVADDQPLGATILRRRPSSPTPP